MTLGSPTLSVSVISFNEESNIERCLEAVRDIATEIIVVDSMSTDRTAEIAKACGARVFIEQWKGHVAQKNSAFEKCTCEWILALDCDEVVSPELKRSIVCTIERGECTGYQVNRKTIYLGKWINHAWYPDWNLRLIRRNSGSWTGLDPHDSLVTAGKVGRLTGDLYHFSFQDFQDCLQRTVRYAVSASQSYQRDGRRVRFHNLLINPLHGFIKHYFVKKGFLDGLPGFVISVMSAITIFMKYVLLWERQHVDKTQEAALGNGKEP
ncbi:glycosyltransferase family 2 protein [Oryzomonas sp.]|uniref:glycosyltransferase family 2 protein n=1 Tax=Oryzomonas sp. TaxID=2855186 RepID=UPI0028529E67|nr:glycosyltransferase family 2 protein [Oryzomonas sp.]